LLACFVAQPQGWRRLAAPGQQRTAPQACGQ
jgi:hypothetical protein